MLVIAGPGSGKTGSIQLRAVNLLLTGRTNPGELALCTFGRDAARQLQRRFTSSALACGAPGDFSRVNISTIHSLCHRLLKPHAVLVGLTAPATGSWTTGNSACCCGRSRMPCSAPTGTPSPGAVGTAGSRRWTRPQNTSTASATNSVDPEDLARSGRPFIAALGRCCLRYRNLLLQRNAVDFAHLQVWAHRVMQGDTASRRRPALTSGT